jgi:hypothetical protein
MADGKKKADRSDQTGPSEDWADRLGGRGEHDLTGVVTYTGLLRQSPSDENVYQLYLSLDMGSCLYIQKRDVVHWEDLPAEKSPFGSLGGCRVYVRDGATIKSVRTATSTFEVDASRPDEFDLDVRLGPRGRAAAGGAQTIPETGCGAECETLPPFTAGGCQSGAQTFCNCTLQCTIDSCPCIPTQAGKTCGANCHITRALTCVTNCGTCATCQTNCGTCATNCGTCRTNCGTCNTNCGTCRVNTCNTKCGQETCGPCTHIFTDCNQHTCAAGLTCGVC